MKWKPGKRSGDLEDRRSQGGGLGGGGFPIPMGRMGGGGIVGVIIAVVLYFLVSSGGGGGGFDVPAPGSAFPQVPQSGSGASVPGSPDEDKQVDFVSFVLDDAQGFWKQQFQAAGKPYQRAKLVLFRNQVSSGCGLASSETGPFYCPLDQKVYIDLGFFDELNRRFKAPGDFAQAYVLAHEIGHHIQQQLGIEQQVREQSQSNPGDANELSVRLELQADCLAGVWGHSAAQRKLLEPGDLEEGLGAAASVGDDRIQQKTQGRVDPESWTHGSAAERQKWFKVGFDSGDPAACDTFKA
jgi:uncharacterized protein